MREPDLLSKRDVPYWFGPEWVRTSNGTTSRIVPIKTKNGNISLHILGRNGLITYIQGSIQREFLDWYKEREFDSVLLDLDVDSIIEVDWEYE